jgi:sigma-E factor negative regulatory protein RseB
MMKSVITLTTALSLCCFSALSFANSNLEKIEKMVMAVQQLNYQGVYTYQNGNSIQTIKIIHRADDKGEAERLISLTGAAREVVRTNDVVTCIFPEGKRVNVNRRPLGRGFPGNFLRRLDSATDFYKVSEGSDGRVAGRLAQELIITPIDDYRYGFKLWRDLENHFLLKSELVTQAGNVLENFTFSTVEFVDSIDDELLEPAIVNRDEMTWNISEPESAAKMASSQSLSQWQLDWLPAGFALVAQQNRLKAKNGASVEQRVYSDGLSTISVFIEPIRARHGHLKGVTKMGAVNAFGTVINGHFVTVVGEVPEHTVNKIGAAISYSSEH